MATNSTILDDSVDTFNAGVSNRSRSFTIPSGVASGDRVLLFTVPYGAEWRLSDVILNVAATLGASATVQARIDRGGVYTAISAATTAGGASKVTGIAQTGLPMNLEGGDIVELLVGGAATSAASAATLDLMLSAKPV